MHDIFLSYGHDDLSTASRFAQGFEREGFTVWWDASLRSGEAFDAAIESALKSAKAVVCPVVEDLGPIALGACGGDTG